ncbi:MAG: hypothetical protein HY606_12155 [Planctomycetes bacterium]|nr:hypothetical protein [Planctomycetota bacterium]
MFDLKLIAFKSAAFDELFSFSKAILIKRTLLYLFGLLMLGTGLTVLHVYKPQTYPSMDQSNIGLIDGSLGFFVFIVINNLVYLVSIDILFDFGLKKRILKRNILLFSSSLNIFNCIKLFLAVIVYLVYTYDTQIYTTAGFLVGNLKPSIFFVCTFVLWWQWLTEAILFAKSYGKRLIFAFPAVVLCRILTCIIVLAICSYLYVELFDFLGIRKFSPL